MNFYENYMKMCIRAGKSPSKVAEEVGISKSIVSRWKNGGGVTDATASRLAAYFGVSLQVMKGIVTEQEEAVIDALESGVFSETDIKKSADQKVSGLRGTGYDELTPENRAMIDSLIESLLKSQSAE